MTAKDSIDSARSITVLFFLATTVALAAYLNTVSSSIAGGDAGELAAEGCTLGTAHPPGYPLYTLLVYTATSLGRRFFPSLTPAFVINAMSSVFSSFSCGLVAAVIFKLTGDKEFQCEATTKMRFAVALSVSLACAFSPLVWTYSVTAEVFALHGLFVSAIMFAAVLFEERPDSVATVSLGAWLSGLALTNQHTSVLLVIPVACWVVLRTSLWRKPRAFAVTVTAFLVGMGPYVSLPLLSIRKHHPGSWGDVQTMQGLLHHFLRRDYGTLQLFSGDDSKSEGAATRTLSWGRDFAAAQLGIGPSLLLAAACTALCFGTRLRAAKHIKRNPHCRKGSLGESSRQTLLVMLASLVFYLVVFHSLANLPISNELFFGIHQRFWIQPNIITFVLLGWCLNKCILTLSKGHQGRMAALTCFVLVLPFTAYWRNVEMMDQSGNNHFRQYALAVLDTLPQDSLLFANYDQQWTSIRYLQECEGHRKDVTSINLSMMTYSWWDVKRDLYDEIHFPGTHYTRGNSRPWLEGGFTFSELVDANIERFGGNIFIGGPLNYADPEFADTYEEVPHGFIRRVERRKGSKMPIDAEEYRTTSLEAWRIVTNRVHSLPDETKYDESTWEYTIRREFFTHLVSRATYLLDLALTSEGRHGTTPALASIAEAVFWLELACNWDGETYSRQTKKNMGLAYLNIVRSKDETFPVVENIFNGIEGATAVDNWVTDSEMWERNSWKEWATTRWREEWQTFLSLGQSKSEPGYEQIKNIYNTVMESSGERAKMRGERKVQ